MTESPPTVNPRDGAGESGVLRVEGAKASITFRRLLHHRIDRVWAAITEPKELETWFMVKVSRENTPGGRLEMEHPNAVHAKGRVIEWSPPRVYEYEWNLPPGPFTPEGESSVVRWELSPIKEGTMLVVTHRKLSRPTAETFSHGFKELIDRLVAHLDGAPLLLPTWMRRADATGRVG